MQELKIKQEFRDLIPPLAPYELEALEEEIWQWARAHSPIITWNGTIVDGHHRYEICRKHNLPFKVEEREFASENEAEIWIINNQFGRRNLNDFLRGELILALKPRLKKQAEENSSSNNRYTQESKKESINEWQNFATRTPKDQSERDSSRVNAKLGKEVGVSREQIRKIEKLKGEGVCTPEEIKALREGKVSVNKKLSEKKREQNLETLEATEFPKGKYRVIYADPPWQYGTERGYGQGDAVDQYPTMSLEEICELPVPAIADENAVLFLWATTPLLQEGLDVMKAWGFDYKTTFVWDKVRSFFGHYTAVAQEFLLVGTKGSCLPDCDTLPHSVVRIEKGRHSEKPEGFRETIETLYKYGNKVELFARKKTEGWDVYGNECTQFP